jgi:elongation factor 2
VRGCDLNVVCQICAEHQQSAVLKQILLNFETVYNFERRWSYTGFTMKFRQTGEILRLMHRKDFIRNVGIVAHIDHGKTTLSDNLLVDAGLLAPQVAGSARVLDYLQEEQRRGITIKTANISFLHKMAKETYLINLVDTPGHVDFIGRVSRALRAVDGVIVVVDSVEEIMAQTETVVRQALEERVRPLLFINKVDRLIRELRLSPNEIRQKFTRIINDFNGIIEIYGEPDFKGKWKIDPAIENVVVGSALYKWGFSLKTAVTEKIGSRDVDIIETHRKGNFEKLSETFPLHTAVLDMVAKYVPNPAESQNYRVPKIWKGNLASEIGKAMLNCDEHGPIVMCITQVKSVPDEGLVVAGRVFSGTLKEGEAVFLVNAGQEGHIHKVQISMSSFREPVSEIPAGNIALLTGLQSVRVGETIIDARYAGAGGSFEVMRRASEPVMSVAIEPQDPRDLGRLVDSLNRLTTEDPDLEVSADKETGQYLLNGLGELHLEIASNLLKQIGGGLGLKISDPIASYRETVLKKGAFVTVNDPNRFNRLTVKVEPLDKRATESLEKSPPSIDHSLNEQLSSLEKASILGVEEHVNVLVDLSDASKRTRAASAALVSGFKWACRNGPLCEQPLRGLRVNLIDTVADVNLDKVGIAQISRAMSRATLGSFLTAQPVLLEPIFRVEVSVPLEWIGACINVITRRHGKIESTKQKGATAVTAGYIPVEQTFGLANDLRSATSGHAFWQLAFHHWEKMPDRRSADTVQKLRQRKGLRPEIPRPETFVDEICY